MVSPNMTYGNYDGGHGALIKSHKRGAFAPRHTTGMNVSKSKPSGGDNAYLDVIEQSTLNQSGHIHTPLEYDTSQI